MRSLISIGAGEEGVPQGAATSCSLSTIALVRGTAARWPLAVLEVEPPGKVAPSRESRMMDLRERCPFLEILMGLAHMASSCYELKPEISGKQEVINIVPYPRRPLKELRLSASPLSSMSQNPEPLGAGIAIVRPQACLGLGYGR